MPKCKVTAGSIRADDGSIKSPGDMIEIAEDQLARFAGQVEIVEKLEGEEDPIVARDASSSAGPSGYGE